MKISQEEITVSVTFASEVVNVGDSYQIWKRLRKVYGKRAVISNLDCTGFLITFKRSKRYERFLPEITLVKQGKKWVLD